MENENYQKSRTEKKKEAEQLQKLGLELDRLSVPQLERIDIPENLRAALIVGKSITSNVAGRRHRQYIGTLMRDISPDIIHRALAEAENGGTGASADVSEAAQESSMWAGRLLSGDAADIEMLLSECPGLERQQLRQLIRNIKKAKPGPKADKARRSLEELIKREMAS